MEALDNSDAKFKVSYPENQHYKGLPIGDYWIIVLADDYSYVAVSEPTQQHLWVYGRKPTITQDVYQSILDKVVLMMPEINVLNILRTQQQFPLEIFRADK